jgi:sugar (pentulose or hexulose) kinase
VTFFVLNTGGLALEWFHSVFCSDMTPDQFFDDYVPSVLERFLHSEKPDCLEAEIPEWVPFLQGSRYSLEQLKASLSGLTLETTREHILLGLIKGNSIYQGQHIKEVASLVKLGRKVVTTGGGSKIRNFLKVKKRWMGGNFEYEYQDQSSLLGAAMLGQFYQDRSYI